jgi:arginase
VSPARAAGHRAGRRRLRGGGGAGVGGTAVYIHIDLDVLDPEEFGSLSYPEAGGLSVATLRDAVRALTARFPLAGSGITEYAPRREEDRAVLASLVPALLADATTE